MKTLRHGGPEGAIIGSYTYDAAGNRKTYTAGDKVTTYTYDSENRPLTAVTMVGETEDMVLTWRYDVVGNNTFYQETAGGVVKSTVTKQFDNASANTFPRTDTRKDDGSPESQEIS